MKRKSGPRWGQLVGLSSVGLVLGISVGLGAWGGSWLDERWNTYPWLTVLGVVIGSAAGFIQLVREVKRYTDSDE